ncbi:RNA-guided endonuclease IscB [Acetobacterium sp.]|uniref:RNA-guided endonuclease IscB n=1 Tax=Acetobacterium sp. TaxID=1872094 RepID=UPI002F402D58
MTYVLDQNGNPLMPTERGGKVRILLKTKKAKVVCRNPFTIQLLYDSKAFTQPVTLGIDSGYAEVGYSAVTETKELMGGTLKLLTGQKNRLKERRIYRRIRRNRLRYRQSRFSNRARKKGWLAPSIQHKLDSQLRFIERIKKLLPITKTIIEVASFDTQKILKPDIEGLEYQEGAQKDFWNVREYVLHRDNHQCQNPDCTNKASQPILRVHHIVFRDNGGTDKPSNLITLCTQCHVSKNHQAGQFLHDWMQNGKKAPSLKGATFMTMVRWRLVDILKDVGATDIAYGYQTKSNRITLGLEKSHHNDAFCIAHGEEQKRLSAIDYLQRRRNNRSLEKFYDASYLDIRDGIKKSGKELSSGRTSRNLSENGENLRPYRGEKVRVGRRSIRTRRYPFRSGNIVSYEGICYTSGGSHNKGNSVKLLELKRSITPRKLKLIQYNAGIACVA